MSWLSDAHAEWHAVHGPYASCPLDCGAMSPEQREAEDLMDAIAYEDETGTASIRCGSCTERHRSAAAVRACAQLQALRVNVEARAEREREAYLSDATDRHPCSVCGKGPDNCKGHPPHLFTPERITHAV